MRVPPRDGTRPAGARAVAAAHPSDAGASLGAFLLGLGLGAAAALLLAPQSGEDARRRLSRRAQDAGGTARRRAQGLVGDVSAGVSRAVEAGRVAAAQAREDLERRIAETKAAYQAGTRLVAAGPPESYPIDAPAPAPPRPGPRAGVAPGGYESFDDDGLAG